MDEVFETPDVSAGRRSNSHSQRMQHVSLTYEQRIQVRHLPGFNKKSHRIPDQTNSHTQAFVAKLAASCVKEDLDRVFAELRSAFRFKRTEIQSADLENGSGSITTPYFRYASSVYQDPNAAAETIWKRDVSNISDMDQLLTDRFVSAFGNVFDTIEFTPPEPIDLEKIIDRVESLDDDRIGVKFDRHITYCTITLHGRDERIQITREAFQIVHPQAETPQVLIESLFRVQNRLLGNSEQPESP